MTNAQHANLTTDMYQARLSELEREEHEVVCLVEETQAYINELAGRRETLERAIASLGEGAHDFSPSIMRTQHPHGLAQELSSTTERTRLAVIEARQQAVASLRGAVGQMTRRLAEIESAIRRDLAETDRLMQRSAQTQGRAFNPQANRPKPPALAQARDERRAAPRHNVCVEVGFETEDNLYVGFSTDLSEGGVFVATVDLLPMGTPVDLTVKLPDGRELALRGEVRWIRDCQDRSPNIYSGMGIQFLDMPSDVALPLREFLRRREPLFYAD